MMPGCSCHPMSFSTSSSSPACVSLFPAQWAQRALWSQQCLCVHPKCTSGWQFFYGIILDKECICCVTVALRYPPPPALLLLCGQLYVLFLNELILLHTALISAVTACSACAVKILPRSRGGTASGIKISGHMNLGIEAFVPFIFVECTRHVFSIN